MLCLFGASPALASKGVVDFFGTTGTQGGQFLATPAASTPGGAAVNQSGTGGAASGDVYVVDRGNNRVQQFSASGKFIRTFGVDVITSGKPNDKGTEAFEVCDTTAAIPNVAADCKAGTAVAVPGAIAGAMRAPQGIAIEQATGNLYVTDQTNRRVDAFSATGAFQGAFGWGVDTGAAKFEFCTTASTCQAPAAAGANLGQFGTTMGFPAVSPFNGDVLVADKNNRRVDVFKPTVTAGVVTGASLVRAYGWNVVPIGKPGDIGEEAFEICTSPTTGDCQAGKLNEPGPNNQIGQFGQGSPATLAVDSTGKTYTTEAVVGTPLNNRVQTFSATGVPEGEFAPGKLSGEPGPVGVAIDPSNDHVLAIKPCKAEICPGASLSSEVRVLEFNSLGSLLDAHAANAGIPIAHSLATASAGKIYLTTSNGSEARAGSFILDSPLVGPGVAIEPVTTLTGTTATFKGKVTPGSISAGYHFEYSPDGVNWTKTPVTDAKLSGDSEIHAVNVEVKELEALTDYQVRLVGTKAFAGGSSTAETSFKTSKSPPVITATSHSGVHDTSVTFKGAINPENEATKYQFEYTDEASFEAEGFFGASHTPVPAGGLSGDKALEVEAQAEGLSPTTTYRYRLSAFNGTGTTHGEVGKFTTYQTQVEGLPDERAYEQASPVDKGGNSVVGSVRSIHAAIDGNAVTFSCTFGCPIESDGAQETPFYLASRGEDGWTSQGLRPPASTGRGVSGIAGWTPDFSQVFDTAVKFGSGTTFLARSSADGSLKTIVPYTAGGFSPDFSGANADGSVVVFETAVQLLPTAPIGRPNVYVWDRASEALSLAGVLNDGKAFPGGSFAGPYDWVNGTTSETLGVGGAAQSYYTQDLHAVSTDAGDVFFTAGSTGQLYVRKNPTEEQSPLDLGGKCTDPLKACTVRISTSQKDNGLGPDGTDAAGTRPATFMAATPDGSKAFFTSSEKLTNDATTGVEPTTFPAVVRADIDGNPVDLGFVPASTTSVAVDSEHVYWVDAGGGEPGEGSIGRAEIDGSKVEPEFIPGVVEGVNVVNNPQGVAVDSEHIYWTNDMKETVAGEGKKGTISRARLNGSGAATEIEAEFIKEATKPLAVAVDGAHIYWTNSAPSKSSSSYIGRADIDGNSASVKQDFLEIFDPGQELSGIAVDSSRIYVMDTVDTGAGPKSRIGCADLDGENYEITCVGLFFGGTGGDGVAVDGTYIYWSNTTANTIGRALLDGTDFEANFITNVGQPQGLAVDSLHLYWSANQEVSANPGNDLYRYDADTGKLTDLAPDVIDSNGAEVRGVLGTSDDGSYAYFVANGVLTNTPNSHGETAASGNCPKTLGSGTGVCNLYLAEEITAGEIEISFIARLAHGAGNVSDAANWTGTPDGVSTARFDKPARVSSDGSILLFRSFRKLTDYDNKISAGECGNGGGSLCPEFYRYDAGDGSLICVSCNPTGASPVGAPTQASISPPVRQDAFPAALLTRALSENGERIFFESPDALVATDVNGDLGCPSKGTQTQKFPACRDVYMWEAEGSGSCESDEQNGGCLYLLSTGKSPHPSFLADASASGGDVFLFTTSQLVRQDMDELVDVYDVRVGGGLESQNEAPKPTCDSVESCHGGVPEPPVAESPGTPSFVGPSDPTNRPKPRPRCPKGKRKVRSQGKTHCVPKRHKHQRRNRNASTNRRASR